VSGVTVREAGPEDAAVIGAFMLAAWDRAGSGAPGYSGATDEVMAAITTEEAVRARIAPPERRMFVACDGDVVGFAATRRLKGDGVELAGIIVAPDLAGRGIGSMLLSAAVAAAGADGCRRMIVRTEIDNEPALAFYERHGFTRTRRLEETVEDAGLEVWELAKDLV
jgi:ribosomal protein S18 acetylase RimI-like enzyme